MLFRSPQEGILAARHQQQQTLLGPVEGWNEFGAILDGEPPRSAGPDIDQPPPFLKTGFGRERGLFDGREVMTSQILRYFPPRALYRLAAPTAFLDASAS